MASGKRTPKVSRISRGRTLAYARKQKPSSDGENASEPDGDDAAQASDAGPSTPAAAGAPAAPATERAAVETPAASPEPPAAATASAPGPDATPPAATIDPTGDPTGQDLRSAGKAGPGDQTSPIESRASADTVAMPPLSIGAPPAMPAAPVRAPVEVKSVEDPTRMPGPREIPGGEPDDPAPPPGHVPPGDSRSMRRRNDRYEFALVYRIQTFVISRVGVVGTRGQWRVVEYPTPAMASHAYAKECSRFVSEGFSDYRA
jgi:hypothetical protein